LGLTVGVNEGIFDRHDGGIVTSASLFANAPATADAIRRSRSRPSLGVGVHLTLVDGAPRSRQAASPPWSKTMDGSTLVEVVHRRLPARWCRAGQVERELIAQIDRIRSEGIRLTHLDTHEHVHVYPPLFTIVARLADRFRIPVVRVPYERWSPSGATSGSDTSRAANRG